MLAHNFRQVDFADGKSVSAQVVCIERRTLFVSDRRKLGRVAYEQEAAAFALVNELDKPELLFFELAAIRGDAWFKYGSYAEAMSMKDCKAKMRLVNTIVGSKICVNGTMSARQAAMHYLPIFVNGDEKEERGYCKVFSNEYRSIHGCDAWEFYGGLRDFFRKQKTPLLVS